MQPELHWSGDGLEARPDLLALYQSKQTQQNNLWGDRYLSQIRAGTGHYHACKNIGIKSTVVRQRIDADPEFAEAVEEAEEEYLEELEQVYLDSGRSGDTKVLSDILAKRYSRRWRERPAQIEITAQTEISALPLLEQIGSLHHILEERARLRAGENILEISEVSESE